VEGNVSGPVPEMCPFLDFNGEHLGSYSNAGMMGALLEFCAKIPFELALSNLQSNTLCLNCVSDNIYIFNYSS